VKLCECGCDLPITSSNPNVRFRPGHYSKTEEWKQKLRERDMGNQYALGCHYTEERKQKMRERKMGNQYALGHICHHTEETKQKISNANRGKKRTEEAKRKIGERSSARWQNPEFIQKVVNGLHKKPTISEKKLENILSEIAPEFQYNGGFELGITIGGKIPDFVNVNGKKQIIELFGCWHHACPICCPDAIEHGFVSDEKERIELYVKYGWDCLVVWSHELKDTNQAISKIRRFVAQ